MYVYVCLYAYVCICMLFVCLHVYTTQYVTLSPSAKNTAAKSSFVDFVFDKNSFLSLQDKGNLSVDIKPPGMYVCMYVCVYVCICICAYIFIYIYLFVGMYA